MSAYDTLCHYDWGWTQSNDKGEEGQQAGYSYYLLMDGKPFLTYMTTARGTEAILPFAHIMDRSAYGRRQDWDDSPQGCRRSRPTADLRVPDGRAAEKSASTMAFRSARGWRRRGQRRT